MAAQGAGSGGGGGGGDVLPENVHLLTLQDVGGGEVLLRLAHLYQAGPCPSTCTIAHLVLHCAVPGIVLPVPLRSLRGCIEAASQELARAQHCGKEAKECTQTQTTGAAREPPSDDLSLSSESVPQLQRTHLQLCSQQVGEGGALSAEAEVDVLEVVRRAVGPPGRAVRAVEERTLSGALALEYVSRCALGEPAGPADLFRCR